MSRRDERYARKEWIFGTEPNDFLREQAHRIPAGDLILEAYTPRQLEFGTGGPSDASHLLTLELLSEELDGLDPLVAREVEREVREGQMHRGRGSVVQYVGLRPA
jgi:hypothetical protein